MIIENLKEGIIRNKDEEIAMMLQKLAKQFSEGISADGTNLNIKRAVEIYKEEKLRMDDALAKYIDDAEVFHIPQRGGYKMKEEQKKKISAQMTGRKMSEEAKERHRENSRRRLVFQYDDEYKLVRMWTSTREAAREGGYNNSYVSRACRNGKKAYGFFWSYLPIGEGEQTVRIETKTIIQEKN